MPTPKDAPYKQRQQELKARSKVLWVTHPEQDSFVTNDGKAYEKTPRGMRQVGSLDTAALAAERQRRAAEKDQYLKGNANVTI